MTATLANDTATLFGTRGNEPAVATIVDLTAAIPTELRAAVSNADTLTLTRTTASGTTATVTLDRDGAAYATITEAGSTTPVAVAVEHPLMGRQLTMLRRLMALAPYDA